MCGRAALTTSPEDLREAFGLLEVPELPARFNIAPSQPVAVVRTRGKLELLRWGLVPAWAKDVKVGHKLALARVETMGSKPAFREATLRRRCLVVVSGFYEWKRAGTEAKAPFFFRRSDDKPFALAGIWERWVSHDGEIVESCAIVTRPAREPVESVHDRMPAIVPRDAWHLWLDPSASDPTAWLDARPQDLIALAVGPHVNDPLHEGPECVRAAPEPIQGSLFG